MTPFQFASNSPISGVDLDGLEYVFYLNSPDVQKKYLAVTNLTNQSASDILRQRELTYWALTHHFTPESTKYLNEKGINVPVAEIEFDLKAPKGITMVFNEYHFENNKGKLVEKSRYTISPNDKLDNRPPDAYYPVDVNLAHKDFYSSWNFRGKYYDKSAGTIFGGLGTGSINGYLEGYGYLEFNVTSKRAVFGGLLGASRGPVYGSYKGKYAGTPFNYSGDGGAVGIAVPIGEFFYNWGVGDAPDGKLWKGYNHGIMGAGLALDFSLIISKSKSEISFPEIKTQPKDEKDWHINKKD